MATIDILTDAPAPRLAGGAIWFRAVDISGFAASGPGPGEIYDPSFHDITYVWDFGDSSASFDAPQNMPPEWRDANIAYGREVAHVYRAAGTYSVTLWAIDREGNTAGATTSVMVAAIEDADYPGARTICFDPTGAFAGAPAGAAQVTSASALNSAVAAVAGGTHIRILTARGIDYQSNAPEIQIRFNAAVDYIGTFGTGAKPIIRPIPGRGFFKVEQNHTAHTALIMEGYDFRGGFDAGTATGIPIASPLDCQGVDNVDTFRVTVNDCDLSGGGWDISVRATIASRMAMSGSTCTDHNSYAFFTNQSGHPDGRVAILGNRFVQNLNAPNNGAFNGYISSGGIRLPGPNHVYVAVNDVFTRSGWSNLGTDKADQPCFRGNTSAIRNTFYTLERNVFEGGAVIYAFADAGAGNRGAPGNYLIDRLVAIATAKTIDAFSVLQYGGITQRNVLAVMPDVPAWHSNGFAAAMYYENKGSNDAENYATPVRDYQNTWLNLRGPVNLNGLGRFDDDYYGGLFDNDTHENNIRYAPHIGGEYDDDAPLDFSVPLPGVTPRYRGIRFDFEPIYTTFTSEVAPGGTQVVPYSSILDYDGTPTNQVYWQAIAATDVQHRLRGQRTDGQMRSFNAENGDFTVSFDAAGITLTNTSTATFQNGGALELRLDRKSLQEAMRTEYANPSSIPLPRPLPRSPALNAADAGYRAYDDFLLRVRPGPGPARDGTPRPSTGNEKGALLEN